MILECCFCYIRISNYLTKIVNICYAFIVGKIQ